MSTTLLLFKQSLTLMDATMIVAGSMIGSGIFIVSADITRNVGSAGWLIAVWLITGFMTITAAVGYGELSGMYPKAVGQYVYLKAFNPILAFLYGWVFLLSYGRLRSRQSVSRLLNSWPTSYPRSVKILWPLISASSRYHLHNL